MHFATPCFFQASSDANHSYEIFMLSVFIVVFVIKWDRFIEKLSREVIRYDSRSKPIIFE